MTEKKYLTKLVSPGTITGEDKEITGEDKEKEGWQTGNKKSRNFLLTFEGECPILIAEYGEERAVEQVA
jgi:hypothetical protein